MSTFGRLDVVVNNAGYGNIASIEESSEEDLRAQIETNLWCVINVTRAVLPILRTQRSGHIVQFSSVGGRIGSPGLGAYQTAKWAVEGFSEVLSKEVAPLGIHITLVEPGGFRTDWAGSSMNYTAPGEDYQQTVGLMYKRLQENSGHEAGDPVRAARAVMQIVNEEQPPLRLLLGKSAVQLATLADEAKLAETRKWAKLSESADFDVR
jgi:NAD(P)-dependent dehydrogenase (short-subunit alcohol dehydrogenase family)